MKVFLGKDRSCRLNFQYDVILFSIIDKVEICDDPEDADIIVFPSSCVHTKSMLLQSLLYINSILKRKKADAVVYLTGCMTREFIDQEKFSWLSDWLATNIDYVIPQNECGQIINAILGEQTVDIHNFGASFCTDGENATIFISNGCQNKCSFCKTTFQKYPIRSADIGAIKDTIQCCSEAGVSKLSIKGTNICQYGLDLYGEYKLPEIIECIENSSIPKVGLIGFSFAEAIHHDFGDILRRSTKVNLINGGLESGSDRLLELMRKGFTAQEIIDFCLYINSDRLKKIYLNIIAGYPSETVEDLRLTLDVIEAIRPYSVDIAPYVDTPYIDSHFQQPQLSIETIEDRARTYKRALEHKGIHSRVVSNGFRNDILRDIKQD